MTDFQRITDLIRKITDLLRKRDELQSELENLTAVRQFDPNDESTHPEPGRLLVAKNPEEGIELYKGGTTMLARGAFWSYSAPALQAKLKSLTTKKQ